MRHTKLLLVLIFCLATVRLDSMVAALPLTSMALESTHVLLVDVLEFETLADTKIAKCRTLKSYKGQPFESFYLYATRSWTCDTSDSVKTGEALIFMNEARGLFAAEGSPEFKWAAESISKPGSMMDKKDLEKTLQFKKTYHERHGGIPLLFVSDSGRGYMPTRLLNEEKYVTLWSGDLWLPTDMKTIDGPEKEYASFIRSVKWQTMESYLLEIMQMQRNYHIKSIYPQNHYYEAAGDKPLLGCESPFVREPGLKNPLVLRLKPGALPKKEEAALIAIYSDSSGAARRAEILKCGDSIDQEALLANARASSYEPVRNDCNEPVGAYCVYLLKLQESPKK